MTNAPLYQATTARRSSPPRRRQLFRIGVAALLTAGAGALLGRGIVSGHDSGAVQSSLAARPATDAADQIDLRVGVQQATSVARRTVPGTPAPLTGRLIGGNGTTITLQPVGR